jgi:hypothetical protein
VPRLRCDQAARETLPPARARSLASIAPIRINPTYPFEGVGSQLLRWMRRSPCRACCPSPGCAPRCTTLAKLLVMLMPVPPLSVQKQMLSPPFPPLPPIGGRGYAIGPATTTTRETGEVPPLPRLPLGAAPAAPPALKGIELGLGGGHAPLARAMVEVPHHRPMFPAPLQS